MPVKMKISSLKRERVSRSSERVECDRQERKEEENLTGSGNREKGAKSTMLLGRYFQG
jgi:hypothetical protein